MEGSLTACGQESGQKREEKRMRKKRKKTRMAAVLGTICLCSCLLAGCAQGRAEDAEHTGSVPTGSTELSGGAKSKEGAQAAEYVQTVAEITVPERVKIVGLGEATHGNSELQTLKKEVFQALAEHNGCRVFAIEGDFGGSAKVNEYISGGEGTAEEAAAEIGFAIYRTREMADLLTWMREYNAAVSEEEQLKFYGFDMQRYDNNKEYLFHYLEKTDDALAKEYETLLADLNDDTVYDEEEKKVTAARSHVEELLETMKASRESYLAKTTEEEYEFALQCAQSVWENATLRTAGTNYSRLRDEYMKNKVDWILSYEGDQMIFITGHNGHIEKTSASGYISMGNRLADSYGEDYFAIGTDLLETSVNVNTSNGENVVISVSNKNEVTALFQEAEENISYLDMTRIPEDSDLGKIVSKENRMLCIGAEFNSWQKLFKSFYTLKMIPDQAYDGLIVLKNGTPTVSEFR